MPEPVVRIDEPLPRVRRITLARPAALNAIDAAMRLALEEALEAANADAATRVIVLAAEGQTFSAGGDLRFMRTLDRAALQAFHRDLLGCVRALARSPKATIAAVQGACAGGALGLALACDYLVAGRGARFSAPFLRIGLTPDMGIGFFLQARLGAQGARRFILDDRPVGAAEALASGLCDRLVEDAALAAKTIDLAERLAALAPRALGQTKRLLAIAGGDLDGFLERELVAAAPCLGGPEFLEGVAAFREKRPPRFGEDRAFN